jgi:hypothetical protein
VCKCVGVCIALIPSRCGYVCNGLLLTGLCVFAVYFVLASVLQPVSRLSLSRSSLPCVVLCVCEVEFGLHLLSENPPRNSPSSQMHVHSQNAHKTPTTASIMRAKLNFNCIPRHRHHVVRLVAGNRPRVSRRQPVHDQGIATKG